MLTNDQYFVKFNKLQKKTIEATNELINWIVVGKTEKEIADKYYTLLSQKGLNEHWYPVLVYSGEITGKPITRKVHLPSKNIVVKKNDIVFVDCTPIDGTTWSNWCDTVVIGENKFYSKLIKDVKKISLQLANYARKQAKTVGDLYNHSTKLINKIGLTILDPHKDVGHSIFQVPEGQTVDKTPMKDRLLLNEDFKNKKLEGIISIEPQLGRVNPEDGKMYGAKLQEVVILK